MSIINEALKKANTAGPVTTTASVASPISNSLNVKKVLPGLEKKKAKLNWGPVFVLLVLVLITGPLLAPIFSSPYRSTNSAFLVPSYQETLGTSPSVKNSSAQSNRAAQFAIEESPILPAAPLAAKPPMMGIFGSSERPNFSVNGIVYSSPESYCLINGRVVRVGEKINGAILKSVTPDKATLEYNGSLIDLWINH